MSGEEAGAVAFHGADEGHARLVVGVKTVCLFTGECRGDLWPLFHHDALEEAFGAAVSVNDDVLG